MKTVITKQIGGTFRRLTKSFGSVTTKIEVLYRKVGYTIYLNGKIVKDRDKATSMVAKLRTAMNKFDEATTLFDEILED